MKWFHMCKVLHARHSWELTITCYNHCRMKDSSATHRLILRITTAPRLIKEVTPPLRKNLFYYLLCCRWVNCPILIENGIPQRNYAFSNCAIFLEKMWYPEGEKKRKKEKKIHKPQLKDSAMIIPELNFEKSSWLISFNQLFFSLFPLNIWTLHWF